MSLNPRHWVIRWLTPRIWRLFPQRKLAALQEFSLVESDSGGQLMACIPLVDDPKLKAYIFQHVLEEVFHGEIFADLCKKLSPRPLPLPLKPRRELALDKNELIPFFSYVHIGEQAVNRDFLQYARASLPPTMRAVFHSAGSDEGKHEADTGDILRSLCGSPRVYRKALSRARWKRRWMLYTDGMSRVGGVTLALLLSLVYFVSGGLVAWSSRRRLRLGAKAQLELLRRQVADFERRYR